MLEAVREIDRAMSEITELRTSGRLREALRLSVQTLALAEATGDSSRLARTQVRHGFVLLDLGRHMDAIPVFESVETCALETEDDDLLSLAWRGAGRAHFLRGDYVSSLIHFEKALELAFRRGREKAACIELGHLATVNRAMGRLDLAFALYRDQLSRAASMQNARIMTVCLSNLADVCNIRGRFRVAAGLYRESIELARESGNRISECVAMGNLGLCLARSGRLREALECFRSELAIATETSYRRGTITAHGHMGMHLEEMGRYDEAMEEFQRQFRSAWEVSDHCNMSQALGNIACIHSRRGDHSRAMSFAKRRIRTAERTGDLNSLARGLAALGHFCMLAGGAALTDAISSLERSASMLRKLGMGRELAECLYDLAASRDASGSGDALETARKALSIAIEAGDESSELFSRMLIESIRGRTDPGSAISELEGLLPRATDERHEAALRHALYRLTGREDHREAALRLYRSLYGSFPNAEFRSRLEEVAAGG